MITGAQIRMARTAIGWTIGDLAQATGVSISAIQRAEQSEGVPTMRAPTLFRVQRALQRGNTTHGGVVFIDSDDQYGPGVRLRRRLNDRDQTGK
jgi:transcriptional regulator with XRE-family HTH domain